MSQYMSVYPFGYYIRVTVFYFVMYWLAIVLLIHVVYTCDFFITYPYSNVSFSCCDWIECLGNSSHGGLLLFQEPMIVP